MSWCGKVTNGGLVDLPEQATRPTQLGVPFQTSSASCLWWRGGRVELYREHGNSVLVAA